MEVVGRRDEANPPGGKALFLAILACLESDREPMETLSVLRKGNKFGFPNSIVLPFNIALRTTPALVDRFLEEGDLVVEEISLSPAERSALDLEHCCEAARLADLFQRAADALNPEGETLAAAFMKAEEAFEAAHNTVFAQTSPSLLRIQCILTGQPLTQEMAVEQES